MLFEQLDDLPAVLGVHDVRYEDFLSEVANVHDFATREPVLWIDHQSQLIAEKTGGHQLGLFGDVGNDSQIQLVIQNGRGNFVRRGSYHGNPDVRMGAAVTGKDWQERVDGAFIYAQRELAAGQSAQIFQAVARLLL